MPYCLTKKLADEFKAKLRSGEIDPAKLTAMTSAERRAFFEGFLGKENALKVNSLFESKILLKNQQLGYINWAKQVTGLKPDVRRDLISRISKMDRILSPAEEKAFLSDLAETRLGVKVTVTEAKTIMELSNKLTEASKIPDPKSGASEYGTAKVAMENYIKDVKLAVQRNIPTDYIKNPLLVLEKIASNAKSIRASMDVSALGRQGWRTLLSHPVVWAKNAVREFGYILNTLKGKDVESAIKAEIYSRENALNDMYRKMRVDIGTGEEAFPTSLPAKIPLFGRLYKASEVAYTGFLYRVRADLADLYLKIAEKTGVDIGSKTELESIGKMINSLTGRGGLGSLEKIGKQVNIVFFSPKFLKSHMDFLTAHQLQKGVTPFVRKQAAINLLKVISGIATILVTAKALGGKTEKDWRSADAGKIRVKDTRFDVTGGQASLLTLATRLAYALMGKPAMKSSTTGKITELGTGYGQTSTTDLIYNFFENKLSPAAAVVKDIINGAGFMGEKITLVSELKNLFVPLPITTYEELKKNPNSADILLSIIADVLGISTNTYSAKK